MSFVFLVLLCTLLMLRVWHIHKLSKGIYVHGVRHFVFWSIVAFSNFLPEILMARKPVQSLEFGDVLLLLFSTPLGALHVFLLVVDGGAKLRKRRSP